MLYKNIQNVYIILKRYFSMNRISQQMSFLEKNKNGELFLRVNVKPGSKQTQVVGESEGSISVQVAAPPRDGECNKALVEFIAELFKIKKSNVSLTHGHKSRDKILSINGITLEEAQKLIKDSINS